MIYLDGGSRAPARVGRDSPQNSGLNGGEGSGPGWLRDCNWREGGSLRLLQLWTSGETGTPPIPREEREIAYFTPEPIGLLRLVDRDTLRHGVMRLTQLAELIGI